MGIKTPAQSFMEQRIPSITLSQNGIFDSRLSSYWRPSDGEAVVVEGRLERGGGGGGGGETVDGTLLDTVFGGRVVVDGVSIVVGAGSSMVASVESFEILILGGTSKLIIGVVGVGVVGVASVVTVISVAPSVASVVNFVKFGKCGASMLSVGVVAGTESVATKVTPAVVVSGSAAVGVFETSSEGAFGIICETLTRGICATSIVVIGIKVVFMGTSNISDGCSVALIVTGSFAFGIRVSYNWSLDSGIPCTLTLGFFDD